MITTGRLVLAAGLGSGCGAVARWLLAVAMVDVVDGFPWATLLANVLGSLLIGGIGAISTSSNHPFASPVMRQFLMVGFCGGFTTFSIFSLEVLTMLLRDEYAMAFTYVSASLVLWLVAVWLGFVLGRHFVARTSPTTPLA